MTFVSNLLFIVQGEGNTGLEKTILLLSGGDVISTFGLNWMKP